RPPGVEMVLQLIFVLEATEATARWRVGRGKHCQIGVAHPACALSPDPVESAVAIVPQVLRSAIQAGYVEPRSAHRGLCHAEHGIGRVKQSTSPSFTVRASEPTASTSPINS